MWQRVFFRWLDRWLKPTAAEADGTTAATDVHPNTNRDVLN
jgi:hypothetical protein